MIETKTETLSEQHREHLRASGLTDNSIEEYGFMTVDAETASDILGRRFDSGGLAIPYPGIDYCRIRPDVPRRDGDKDVKYESPLKSKFPDGNALFITHLAEDILKNTTKPLYFTEGEKKAVALEQVGLPTISIPGVWNWRTSDKEQMWSAPIAMLINLPLKDREVFIIFDSDKFQNNLVMQAERRLASCLSSSFGAKVKIVNLDPAFGKGADDQILKLGKEDFKHYVREAKDFNSDDPKACQVINTDNERGFRAISCTELKILSVPPVEYLVEDIFQKGLNFVEGDSEACKTNTCLALAIEMTTSGSTFLDRFEIKPCRVLYVDLEMGVSALKERIHLLLAGMGREWPESLHVISPGTDEGFEFDLKTEKTQKNLEREIEKADSDIIFLDTLFDSSSYDLISHNDSGEIKKYLKKIRSQFNLAVVLIHHRRKPSGDRPSSSGKHELYGSVVLFAAADRVVSVAGTADEISVVCSKARNGTKFQSFIMKLCADKPKDATKLWFEYVGQYKEQGSVDQKKNELVEQIFNSFGKDKVSKSDLTEKSKELGGYGWETLRKRLLATKRYIAIDKAGQETYIGRVIDVEAIDDEKE